MNKTVIAYLCCIRSFLTFKTNALWFIVFIYENSNNKDKLANIKQINESAPPPPPRSKYIPAAVTQSEGLQITIKREKFHITIGHHDRG